MALAEDAREEALAAAYAAHAASVTSLAARLLEAGDAARDVCQEAFVRLYGQLDLVRGDPGPWLRTVAWRLAFDLRRRRDREARALARAPERGAPAPAAFESDDAIQGALADLSERQREVLLLRVVDEATFPAVARTLSISEGSAKVHLRRALERLRDALGVPARRSPAPNASSPTDARRP